LSRKIYVASSWRNEYYPEVVKRLRAAGHQCYDFRYPNDPEGPFPNGKEVPDLGFNWRDLDPNWGKWTVEEYKFGLEDPRAVHGFERDMTGLHWANTAVLLLQSGKSAHLEAGWASGWRDAVETIGRGHSVTLLQKQAFAFIPPDVEFEPELMYRMFNGIAATLDELLVLLA
jgi:hypothetical protein